MTTPQQSEQAETMVEMRTECPECGCRTVEERLSPSHALCGDCGTQYQRWSPAAQTPVTRDAMPEMVRDKIHWARLLLASYVADPMPDYGDNDGGVGEDDRTIAWLADALAASQARAESAEADSRRLGWIESRAAQYLGTLIQGYEEGVTIFNGTVEGDDEDGVAFGQIKHRESLRAAIDAAMEGGSNGPSAKAGSISRSVL